MWKTIKPVLASLFSSKKFLAFLAGALVWVAKQAGADIPKDQLISFLGLVSVYVLGQGVADLGKEKEKVKAATIEKLGSGGTASPN